MRIQHRASYVPRSYTGYALMLAAGMVIGATVAMAYLAVLASLTTP